MSTEPSHLFVVLEDDIIDIGEVRDIKTKTSTSKVPRYFIDISWIKLTAIVPFGCQRYRLVLSDIQKTAWDFLATLVRTEDNSLISVLELNNVPKVVFAMT